ncbi:MAG: CHC2 zinc finger domain-containing protein [Syntrophorhabdaceae bacterium]|nr:CHC2 zinc finger domain-containing protein [Syntrophorhabdaceae bacterium]
MFESIAEILDDFKVGIVPLTREKIRQHVAEYPEEFKNGARVEYLKECMEGMVEKALYLMADYEKLSKTDDVDTRLFVGDQLLGTVKTISKLQDEIYFRRHPANKQKQEITDDDIRRAKEYPFEELYEFKRGMALCPFHDDRQPSFSLHNNRATCFGACGKTWDTIAFVMEREGLSFIDAVKRLR